MGLEPKSWWNDITGMIRKAVLGGMITLAVLVYDTTISIQETQERLVADVEQIQDELDSSRLLTTEVVVWAPNRSQELTDDEGACDLDSDEVCFVVFRGRRTVEGLSCKTVGAELNIMVNDIPRGLNIHETFAPTQLGLEFKNIAVPFEPESFIPRGRQSVFIMVFYEECDFAPEGEKVERPTVTVSKEFI